MFSVFKNSKSRNNPHTLWKGREIATLSSAQKDSVAEGISQLEATIWTPIMGRWNLQGKDDFLGTLRHHKDVIVAVSYELPEQKFTGPYLSYIIGYEIDVDEGIHDDEIELLEDVTGRSYDDILQEIPSHKIFYFEDYSRLPTEQARVENARMSQEVLQHMKSEGIGIYGDFRESTSYRLINTRYAQDFTMLLDIENRDYYAHGEHMHSIVGYFR
jgi:hypothetical protein